MALELVFKECETCAAKLGAPILCAGCLNNRTVINELMARRKPVSPKGDKGTRKVRGPLLRPSGKIMGKQKGQNEKT